MTSKGAMVVFAASALLSKMKAAASGSIIMLLHMTSQHGMKNKREHSLRAGRTTKGSPRERGNTHYSAQGVQFPTRAFPSTMP